jgi:16S rRNA (adenine1518-N6/adenine1519-N6)-dimethyltransferase
MNPKLFDHQYLKHLCQKYGLVPSKKYGQNFLINPEPIENMVEAAEIKPGDVVVEVGPGFGVLTLALVEKAKKVLSFEIEKKIEPYWNEELKKHNNLEIVWGNVLHEVESQNSLNSLKSYKVVANLPYQITSQILRTFLEMENKPEVMVLMVQKEVAERICAPAGDMSVLSVSVQYYGEPEIIAYVPRSSFWPVPAVDSAVIRVRINKNKAVIKNEADLLFKIVKAGFSSRRKMLIKNLSAVIDKDKIRSVFKELGIDEKVRAQELSVEQWRLLTIKLQAI